MPIKIQQGIISPTTNPIYDAQIIMTAAIVGHAYTRLSAGHECRFDYEAKVVNDVPTADSINDKLNHDTAIAKINKALANGGLSADKIVTVGTTPSYDKDGNVVRITGGTGNLPATNPDKYYPALPTGWSKELYNLTQGKDINGVPLNDQGHPLAPVANVVAAPAVPAPVIAATVAGAIPVAAPPAVAPAVVPAPVPAQPVVPGPLKLGYQGRGGYTGFVDGRTGGQTGLMSTYRFKIPADKINQRWIPSNFNFGLGSTFGIGDNQRAAWGIIVSNQVQNVVATQGMYFQDQAVVNGIAPTPLDPANDVIGYVHGMIQAIYDVELHKAASGKSGGIPYEVAVGVQDNPDDSTTKLASCLTCALFMEATGYPASSTHLGRGESWCIIHSPYDPNNPNDQNKTVQNISRKACNDKWADYCRKIIIQGMKCMVTPAKNLISVIDDGHGNTLQLSYAALQAYLADNTSADHYAKDSYKFANLILDAVTVHNSECKRINATLID